MSSCWSSCYRGSCSRRPHSGSFSKFWRRWFNPHPRRLWPFSRRSPQGQTASTGNTDKLCMAPTARAHWLAKLVEYLVPAFLGRDPTFVPTFLWNYRAFATTQQVLDLLLTRAIISILGMWLDQFPQDFFQPPDFPGLVTLLAYLELNFPGSALERQAQLLLSELERCEPTEVEGEEDSELESREPTDAEGEEDSGEVMWACGEEMGLGEVMWACGEEMGLGEVMWACGEEMGLGEVMWACGEEMGLGEVMWACGEEMGLGEVMWACGEEMGLGEVMWACGEEMGLGEVMWACGEEMGLGEVMWAGRAGSDHCPHGLQPGKTSWGGPGTGTPWMDRRDVPSLEGTWRQSWG
ncbi:Ral guanine nucleotide dissociation stimulator [Myotis davidii]|uniref:Ral guanine nucleotide dissociation stimulator n=1 Tax=Myotis davidii TaxID=225400 RepID=L5MDC6_MYODS|nr:Ral guanine nucleotide dissociation stimulator [Myotis davidii]